MNTLRCPVIIGLISNARTIPRSLDGHMARHQLSTYLLMYSQWQVRPTCCVGISFIKRLAARLDYLDCRFPVASLAQLFELAS